jgi:surface antigen
MELLQVYVDAVPRAIISWLFPPNHLPTNTSLLGQCTSFVAYRLNKAGVKFTNHYKGEGWHYANTWNEAAKKAGVKVNNTPKVGSVAQTDAGSAGHVAWVTKVGKKTVTIEEYNWNNPEKYGTRTVPKEKFRYIHVKN